MMAHCFQILVVEDEQLILKNLVKKIDRLGLPARVVAQAADGVSALALQEQYLPEIIITDIRLPGMDGLELIYQVQQKYPATKFIVISGYGDFEYAKRAIQLQVSDYLLKPVKEEELCKSLSRLILSVQSAHNDLELELQTEGHRAKVELIKSYIQQNYAKDINVNTIAQRFGYTPTHLPRLFMKIEQVNISKYLSQIRINYAKQLLHDKTILVKRIGEKVGYPDPYHFSKIFKSATGMTPGEYRDSICK